MQGKENTPEITLNGIITANAWSENDTVTGVVIAVDGEKEYLIREGPLLKDLILHVRQEVEVTGMLFKDEKGKPVLSVTGFRVCS